MQLYQLLDGLNGVKGTKNQYSARCPAHDDRTNSLSITADSEKIALHCHAGCEKQKILDAMGLHMSDLFFEPLDKVQSINKNIEYIYTDEEGKPAHKKIRTPDKEFWQYHFEDGKWVKGKGEKSYLYNLPLIINAIAQGETIFFVEGEKDADNLRKIGLVSTTTVEGAGAKFKEAYAPYFKGADVVILPDNDDAGRRHAEDVLKNLGNVVKSVKIVELPNLPDKGDVSDWIQAGGTKEQLYELCNNSSVIEEDKKQDNLGVTDISSGIANKILNIFPDITACEAIEFLWSPFIPKRGVTILQGVTGAAKSVFSNALCCAISLGVGNHPILGYIPKSKVLYFNTEDDHKSVFLPRMMTNKFDSDNFHCFDWFSNPVNFESPDIPEAIDHLRPDIVVFDVLKDMMPQGKDINKSGDVRHVINILKALADKFNTAILLVAHIGKSGSTEGAYRAMGSSDWGSGARSVIEVTEDKDTGVRNIHHRKINGFMKGSGIGFTMRNVVLGKDNNNGKDITAPEVLWQRESKTADEVDAQFSGTKNSENKQDKAEELIIEMLKNEVDGCGNYIPVSASKIDKKLKEYDIKDKTIERAKSQLSKDKIIKYKRFGGVPCWELQNN